MYTPSEAALQSALKGRQSSRDSRFSYYMTLSDFAFDEEVIHKGLVNDGTKTKVQLAAALVDLDYSEIDLTGNVAPAYPAPKSRPVPGDTVPDYAAGTGYVTPEKVRDLTRYRDMVTDHVKVAQSQLDEAAEVQGFMTAELGSSPLAFVAYQVAQSGELVKMEVAGIKWSRGFDPNFTTQRPVVVVNLPNDWLYKSYVRRCIVDLYHAALSGDTAKVIHQIALVCEDSDWSIDDIRDDALAQASWAMDAVKADAHAEEIWVADQTKQNPVEGDAFKSADVGDGLVAHEEPILTETIEPFDGFKTDDTQIFGALTEQTQLNPVLGEHYIAHEG